MFQGVDDERGRVDAALQALAADPSAAAPPAASLGWQPARPAVAPEIFAHALALFSAGRRVDMRALAAELGIGRTSLYRKVGSRDKLLGELIWHLLQRVVRNALAASGQERGVDRLAMAVAIYMDEVSQQRWLRSFLAREPSCALRVLLDRSSPGQRGLARAVDLMLEAELQRGNLDGRLRPELVAYPIVRICESFLYLDVINGQEPDIEGAMAALHALMHGHARIAPASPEPARLGTVVTGAV